MFGTFVKDSNDEISILCATDDERLDHPKIRGKVVENDSGEVIFRSLPHPKITYQVDRIGLKKCKIFLAKEGMIVNMFCHRNQWYICSSKKLSIVTSSWSGDPGSFYQALFKCINCIWIGSTNWGDIFEPQVFLDQFCRENLDRTLGYIFMVYTYKERIISNSLIDSVRLLATYNKTTDTHSFPKSMKLIPQGELEVSEPLRITSKTILKKLLDDLPVQEASGVIIVAPDGTHTKVITQAYDIILKARGEQPKLITRYLYLYEQKTTESEAYIETLVKHFKEVKNASKQIKELRERILEVYLCMGEEGDSEAQDWMNTSLLKVALASKDSGRCGSMAAMSNFMSSMKSGALKKLYKSHAHMSRDNASWLTIDTPVKPLPDDYLSVIARQIEE